MIGGLNGCSLHQCRCPRGKVTISFSQWNVSARFQMILPNGSFFWAVIDTQSWKRSVLLPTADELCSRIACHDLFPFVKDLLKSGIHNTYMIMRKPLELDLTVAAQLVFWAKVSPLWDPRFIFSSAAAFFWICVNTWFRSDHPERGKSCRDNQKASFLSKKCSCALICSTDVP